MILIEGLKYGQNIFRKLSLADEKTTEVIINSNNKYSEISDARISWAEIKEVLKSMRKGKASGE